MKKILLIALILIMGASVVYAEGLASMTTKPSSSNPELSSDNLDRLNTSPGDMWYEYISWDNDAIEFAYIGLSTETASFVMVHASSISLTVDGGRNDGGTTWYAFATYTTLKSLKDVIEYDDVSTGIGGLQGVWIVNIASGTSEYAATANLASTTGSSVTCFGLTNARMFDFGTYASQELVIEKAAIGAAKHYLMNYRFKVNVASGTPTFNYYEADTAIRAPIYFTDSTEAKEHGNTHAFWQGSTNTKAEFRVYTSSHITSGFMELTGYTKKN